MFKKIIGFTFLFYLVLALTLSLAGVTSVDLMNSSNTFFRAVVNRFNNWGALEIPSIPKITMFSSEQGWLVILNAFIFLINVVVTLANVSVGFINFVIQALEFIVVVVRTIVDVPSLFSTNIIPTMIM